MAKASKKSRGSKSVKRGATKPRRPSAARAAEAGAASPPATLASQQAAEQFTRNVLTRGEACKPGPAGKLEPGCTHEIVEEKPGELPKIQRRRFSIM